MKSTTSNNPLVTTKTLAIGTLFLCCLGVAETVLADPEVSGNTISWPADGWYQVQFSDTYLSVCEGGTSCEVEPGEYIVINHTSGERYEGVMVEGVINDGDEFSLPISVEGNTISWPADGWYQVQSALTYQSVCEGGTSCEVENGLYIVINLTTGERFANIAVGVSFNGISVANHVKLLEDVFEAFTGNNYAAEVLSLPDFPDSIFVDRADVNSTTQTVACPGYRGGNVTLTPFYDNDQSLLSGWDFEFDECDGNDYVYNGQLIHRTSDSASYKSSPGYSQQTGFGARISFSGEGSRTFNGDRSDSNLKHWQATDINYSRIGRRGSGFGINQANTSFSHNLPYRADMTGSFSFFSGYRSDTFQVKVVEDFQFTQRTPGSVISNNWKFQNGILEVKAVNGDTLVLNANNGDYNTVNIQITTNDGTEFIEFTQQWSLWADNLRFNYLEQ